MAARGGGVGENLADCKLYATCLLYISPAQLSALVKLLLRFSSLLHLLPPKVYRPFKSNTYAVFNPRLIIFKLASVDSAIHVAALRSALRRGPVTILLIGEIKCVKNQ